MPQAFLSLVYKLLFTIFTQLDFTWASENAVKKLQLV